MELELSLFDIDGTLLCANNTIGLIAGTFFTQLVYAYKGRDPDNGAWIGAVVGLILGIVGLIPLWIYVITRDIVSGGSAARALVTTTGVVEGHASSREPRRTLANADSPGKTILLWDVFMRTLKYDALILFTITWLLPILAALLTSFRTMDDISINGFWSLPDKLTFDKFTDAWKLAQIRKYLLNSFIITIPSLIGMLFLSSLSAYALARFRFRGNLLIYFLYVSGMMLPFQILLLPVFRLTNEIGLYDTYGALILIHTAFQLGFCTFVLRNFMRTVPNEILDAARVDGCGEFRIYWQIMIPLSLPSLAALATLEFTWVFNDYLWALILIKSDALQPVTKGLANLQGQYTTDWPLITAGAMLATLPTIFVFIFLQRYFIQGLTLGSGK